MNSVRFGISQFAMYSVTDSWGEDDPIIGEAANGKFDENATLSTWAYLASIALDGDLFLDVGSYAGLFSFVAVTQNPNVRVVAFEASTVTYGRLVSNIILNRIETRVCAAHLAAWDERATLKFPHRYGAYSMCPGESALENQTVDHTEMVFTLRLDDLLEVNPDLPGALGSKSLGLRTFGSIAAIKIDVEGAEDRVLNGALEVLSLHQPHIICELLTDDAVDRTQAFLRRHDYVVSQIGTERNYLLSHESKVSAFKQGYDTWLSKQRSALELQASRKYVYQL
jgi:FkbM family methyltransferase